MVKAGHTLGPCTVGESYIAGAPIYRDGDQHFATVFNGTGYDAKQYAALIAAAPELLEALELVRSMPGFEADEVYGHKVIAAIARAKGEPL